MTTFRYWSNTFPIYQKSVLDDRIHNIFSFNEFQKILDLYFVALDSKLSLNGLPLEFNLMQPSNILIGFDNEGLIVVHLSWIKAVKGNTLLGWIKSATTDIDDLMIKQFGTKNHIDITMDLSVLLKCEKLFSKLIGNETMDNLSILYNLSKNNSEDKDLVILFTNELERSYKEYEKQVERRMHIMQFNPIFKAKDFVINDNQAFGILQFDDGKLKLMTEMIGTFLKEEFSIDLRISGDNPKTGTPIFETIWQDINQSAFTIADLSGKNANVFYEVGLCHTVGKPTILICSNESFKNDYGEKLPFDISNQHTIFYDDTGVGVEKLKEEISQQVKYIMNK